MKSTITCDMEGRIETFNRGAEEIFGYSADEIVGKKRVSLFSPGLVVLGHVGTWLQTAVEEGEYIGNTVFERKDGTQFAARIRITPTWEGGRGGEQIGYCGVTEVLDDVHPKDVMPDITLATRVFGWLVITRAPFLTAALVPVLIGGAWAAYSGAAYPWWLLALAALGAMALQVAANTFNDYFDWKSGTDEANTEYFQAFSGGSRAIELRLISERGVLNVGLAASAIAVVIGAVFAAMRGPDILWFGAAGLFSAYFYTAPPLRLVARKGLGELLIGLNFGPLMTAGTVFALTGSVAVIDFLVGLPIGLLTTAILWINEFPDASSDEATGKKHLVVVLGRSAARYGYVALWVVAYTLMIIAAAMEAVPSWALLGLVGLPIGAYATRVLFKHLHDRELVKACTSTIAMHFVAGIAMAIGLAIAA